MKTKNRILTILVAFTFVIATFLLPKSVQASTIYKGTDVYEYSNISNYQQLKNDGVQVVIQKATQGIYHNDSLLYYRYNQLTQYGFKIGFYHYANNSGQPVAEAQHFLSQIKGLHSDTVLWLDIENQPDWSKQQAIDYTNQFISYVQGQGYKIGIYTGMSFYYEYLQGNVPSVPLWLANYSHQPLQFPNLVSWQYSESGQISGMIGNIDMDYFNDSIFTGQAPTVINNVPTQSIQVKSDSQVTSLQTKLSKLLGYKISIDGIPGPQTTQSTKLLQKMFGLSTDGIAGNQTNSAINQVLSSPIIKNGAKGTTVKYLQYRLGINSDGKFGSRTREAVIKYQREHGLNADGIVGQNTWNELLK